MKTLRDDEIEVILKEIFGCVSSDDLWFAQQICNEIEKRNRWVPVSERLPEKEGIYLTTIFLEHIKEKKYQLRLAIYTNSKFAEYPEVTAWKELPEPFKD